jgi:2-oxo-4-hydroxy-4-carboxy-5-ureidoimidazoline decarboxylase
MLNAADAPAFVTLLGGIYEKSPWVAQAAYAYRPFSSVATLHAAMQRAVEVAGPDRQLALLRAHPALARPGPLTNESATEQQSKGLQSLDPDEAAAFATLNNHYQARFGFPFIIAVRGQSDRSAILAALATRIRNTPQQEQAAGLEEVARIARFRLDDLVADDIRG